MIYFAVCLVLAIFYGVIPKIGAAFVVFCPGILLTACCMKWLSQTAEKNGLDLKLCRCKNIALFMMCFFIWGLPSLGLSFRFSTWNGEQLNAHKSDGMRALLLVVIVPITEEVIKFIWISIAIAIFYCAEKSRICANFYYFVLMIGICLGASFGMYENFCYLAAPEWGIKDWIARSGLNATHDVNSHFSKGQLALGRCIVGIPLHAVTGFLYAAFICIIHAHKQQSGEIKWQKCRNVARMLCIPLALHMACNAGATIPMFVQTVGAYLAGVWGMILAYWMITIIRVVVFRFKKVVHPEKYKNDGTAPIISPSTTV